MSLFAIILEYVFLLYYCNFLSILVNVSNNLAIENIKSNCCSTAILILLLILETPKKVLYLKIKFVLKIYIKSVTKSIFQASIINNLISLMGCVIQKVLQYMSE